MAEKLVCLKCGSTWVVNKKYCLCDQCNYKRLHAGKSKQQVVMDKRVETQPKAKKAIPRRSKKGLAKERAKHETYAHMESTREMVCASCGTNRVTHSHILPVSQYGEFEADPRNIIYQCVRCHDIWEHGPLEAVEALSNFIYILAIIELLYPPYFFRRFGVVLEDYKVQNKL